MTRRSAVLQVLAFSLLACASSSTTADELATFSPVGDGGVVLMTERCGSANAKMQRVYQGSESGRRDGCWAVNLRGNPVVLWGDGEVLEIDQSLVTLAPRYKSMLEDLETTDVADDQKALNGIPRPTWCGDAAFPHEKLVCRDENLSTADLALAPLWQAYRNELKLNQVQQGRVKSDYFRRLKACGADKKCIAREQASQKRFYERALAGDNAAPAPSGESRGRSVN